MTYSLRPEKTSVSSATVSGFLQPTMQQAFSCTNQSLTTCRKHSEADTHKLPNTPHSNYQGALEMHLTFSSISVTSSRGILSWKSW